MVEQIEHREDVDGCACLRCRGVDPNLVRRSTVGDVLWSVRLFRRYPSIPLFFLGLAVLDVGLHALSRRLALSAGPIETPLPWLAFLLAFPVVFRGYVGAVTAGALLDDGRSARDALVYSLRRGPAVAGATVGIALAAMLAFGAAMVLVVVVFGLATTLDGSIGLGLVDESVFDGPLFDGIGPTLAFGSVVAVTVFKCWLAPDVCVVGGYGPLEALRISWRTTASHGRRLLVVFLGFAVTTAAPELVGGVFESRPLPETAATDVLATAGLLLSYAVWFSVGAQLYARAAVDVQNQF